MRSDMAGDRRKPFVTPPVSDDAKRV